MSTPGADRSGVGSSGPVRLVGQVVLSPWPPRRPSGSELWSGVWSKAGDEISFALAFLSCTIAPFVTVTAAAVRTGGVGGVVDGALISRRARARAGSGAQG